MKSILTPKEMTRDTNGWKGRHMMEVKRNHPVAALVEALNAYAVIHAERFGSPLADDYVLGPAWLDAAKGVRALLNGECGGLDCGTVDGAIVDMVVNAGGFDEGTL